MFCPNCHSEYREGVVRCAHCDVPLVVELEPVPEPPGPNVLPLVTVLSTADEATVLVARSLLDDAGIRYFTRNEQLQDLLGLGRVGGYNILAGPIVLQVRADDAEVVLGALREAELIQGADDDPEKQQD